MYPDGFATTVRVEGLTDCLCGVSRPGFFDGVATVVSKLLLQAMADVAIFGEKDYQQLLVVRRMARDLDIPVEIIGAPTVREADGLALSSRNAYLDVDARARAATLIRALRDVAVRLRGEPGDVAPALAAAHRDLAAAGFAPIDYLEARNGDSLATAERAGRGTRLFAAAWLGETRLIDNIAVFDD